jgi:glucosamine-6-phosphate deaminase
VPSTILQNHKDCTFVLDKSSSEELTRFKCPWTLKGDLSKYLDFNDKSLRIRAVIWLSNHVKKAISRLTDDDYYENSL